MNEVPDPRRMADRVATRATHQIAGIQFAIGDGRASARARLDARDPGSAQVHERALDVLALRPHDRQLVADLAELVSGHMSSQRGVVRVDREDAGGGLEVGPLGLIRREYVGPALTHGSRGRWRRGVMA